MTVEGRTLNSILVGILSFIINLGQSIILVPILLQSWGLETYGLWISISAVYGILQTIDTGHQNYVGNEICKLYHTDFSALKKFLASSLWMATLLGFSQLFIALGIIYFGHLETLLGANLSLLNHQKAGLVLICLVLNWILSGSIGGILVRLYPAAGLLARSLWWGICMRFVIFLCTIFSALSSNYLLITTLSIFVVTIIVNALLFVDIYRIFYKLYPFWEQGTWKTGLVNLSKSSVLTIAGFFQQIQNNGPVLLVSNVLGATVTPIFTTVRTLSNLLLQASNIITQPLMPEMTRYHVQAEHEKLSITFSASWWVSSIFINLGLIITLPFIEPLYSQWTRGKIDFHWSLYLLLAWQTSIKSFGSPLVSYLASINHLQVQIRIAIVQTTIVLGGGILFVSQYGLVAVGVAVVIGELVSSVLIPIQFTSQELKKMGGQLPFFHMLISLNAVAIVGLVYLAVALTWFTPTISAVVGTLVLITIYLAQWSKLPIEVKIRLRNLIGKLSNHYS